MNVRSSAFITAVALLVLLPVGTNATETFVATSGCTWVNRGWNCAAPRTLGITAWAPAPSPPTGYSNTRSFVVYTQPEVDALLAGDQQVMAAAKASIAQAQATLTNTRTAILEALDGEVDQRYKKDSDQNDAALAAQIMKKLESDPVFIKAVAGAIARTAATTKN